MHSGRSFGFFSFFFPRSSPDLTLPAMTRGVKKDKAMPTYLVDSWGGSCGLPVMGYPGWVHVYGWVTLYGFILCVTTNRGISTWLGQCFPVMGYQDL